MSLSDFGKFSAKTSWRSSISKKWVDKLPAYLLQKVSRYANETYNIYTDSLKVGIRN